MAKKILIIDDSSTVREQLSRALLEAGFEVAEAGDGEEALTVFDANADIALAISDVNMPKLNGLEMLARLRGTPRGATLPVLMLTTEGQPEYIAKAKALGAKGWLVKPFKPELLVAAVRKLAG